jgi:hypothetical protein
MSARTINGQNLVCHGVNRESADLASRGLSKIPGQFRLTEHPVHGIGQGCRIPRLDQNASAGPKEIGNSADPGCHHRHSGGHGGEQCPAVRGAPAWSVVELEP